MSAMMKALKKTADDEKTSFTGLITKPSDIMINSLRQMSFSFTVGVFIGAAITSGAAFGAMAFYLANGSVIKKLRENAAALVASARDAALSTEEGQALKQALTRAADQRSPASPLPSPTPPGISEGAMSPSQLRELVSNHGRKAVCVGKNYRDHIVEMSQLGACLFCSGLTRSTTRHLT
jgi:hypothetical protein